MGEDSNRKKPFLTRHGPWISRGPILDLFWTLLDPPEPKMDPLGIMLDQVRTHCGLGGGFSRSHRRDRGQISGHHLKSIKCDDLGNICTVRFILK